MAEAPPSAPTAAGSFAKTPFAHVLVYLHTREMTGTLEIVDGGDHEHVYFQKGCPAKIRSSQPADPLGRVLLELGLIDEATYNQSLQALAQGHGLQGQILLSMGSLDMPGLIRGLKEQLTRKLLRLFKLQSASYGYFDGVNFLRGYGGDEVLRIDPFPVIYQGVRQSYDEARLHTLLGPVGPQRLRLLESADVRRFGLGPDEIDVCTMVGDQPLTVDEILRHSPLPSSESRALLYCLLITKQVEFVSTAARRATVPPGFPAASPPPPPAAAVGPPRARPASSPSSPPPGGAASPPRARTASVPSTPAAASPRRATPPPPPRPAAKAPEDPELAAKRKEILERAEKIETQSYFEMLGVTKDNSAESIKETYFKLAKVYHPDRALAGLADLKETLEYVFSNITEAYSTLTDKEKRNRYVSLLKEGGGTLADQRKIQIVIDAAMNYQKAEVCLRRKDHAEALRLSSLALEAAPDDGEYQALQAWIQMHTRSPVQKIDDLVQALKKAQALAKESEKTNFYLAMALKRAGQDQQAVVYFKRASIANPRNLDALRELRLHEMRKEKGGPSSRAQEKGKGKGKGKGKDEGGLFGKFFKK